MEGGKKTSKWLALVKKTMKLNKGKTLGQVMKIAKKSYHGGAEAAPESGPSHSAVEGVEPTPRGALSPATVGGRRRKTLKAGRKGGKKTRKGGRKH
jgi:hypothetical protein